MDEPDARLHGAVLLVCRSIWFDRNRPDQGYGMAGILTHLEPPGGSDFPQRVERLFVYTQLWGVPGEYRLRMRLVRIESVGYDDEEEVQLGEDDSPFEFGMPSPRPVEISGLNFLDEVAFPIFAIPIPEVGVYEFQLWVEGSDRPVGSYRIQARR